MAAGTAAREIVATVEAKVIEPGQEKGANPAPSAAPETLASVAGPAPKSFNQRQIDTGREKGKEAFDASMVQLKRLGGFLADASFWAIGASVNGAVAAVNGISEGLKAAKKFFTEKANALNDWNDSRVAAKSVKLFDKRDREFVKGLQSSDLQPRESVRFVREYSGRKTEIMNAAATKGEGASPSVRRQIAADLNVELDNLIAEMKPEIALSRQISSMVADRVSVADKANAYVDAAVSKDKASAKGKISEQGAKDIKARLGQEMRDLYGEAKTEIAKTSLHPEGSRARRLEVEEYIAARLDAVYGLADDYVIAKAAEEQRQAAEERIASRKRPLRVAA